MSAQGPSMTYNPWHILQISDVLDMEFASALTESVPVLAWKPQHSLLPALIRPGLEQEEIAYISPGLEGPNATPVRVRSLPLMRGYARPPMSFVARTDRDVLSRLLQQTPDPAHSPLLCSVPFFAGVAERWPGPVVYWLTDLIAEYSSADRDQVIRLDRRMCRAATLVCPNSQRLASYLIDRAACDPARIEIVPNATRAANVFSAAPAKTAALPQPIESMQRPIAGVIGNLAGNMDWVLLERLVDRTPWLSWVFVGPTSMQMVDSVARRARSAVMRHPNARFVGRQPYGALAGFARSVDVAVLPYLRCEPTASGSSTRFYEHLAACRPMVATRGLDELIQKEPLLTLVDTPEEAEAALDALRQCGFDDGLAESRWHASQKGTWQYRANTVRAALFQRLPSSHPENFVSASECHACHDA